MNRPPITGVVISKLDRPIGDTLDSILPHVTELIVVQGVCGVSERWDAALHARSGSRVSPPVKPAIVYVQDDDALVDVAAVIAAYRPGVVTCNMPADRREEYRDGIALVGWGAVFDASLVDLAFRRYWTHAHTHNLMEEWSDEVFRSEADRIFTGLSTLALIDVPFLHDEVAHGKDRMGRRPNHGEMLMQARRRIYAVRQKASSPELVTWEMKPL